VDMVRFPGGYATITDGLVTFHYYTQDYLGSNRAVVNGSTGAIEQTVAYYPYGSVIADLGTGSDPQPFKFGGKELTLQNGLNEYDFGARQYYPAVPHFTSIDRKGEKYYWLSPYLYCANNPINLSDPTGKIIEMPKGTSVTDILTVMWNMMQLTDDKLVFSTQNDGSIRIKIASLRNGKKTAGTRLIRSLNSSDKTVTINVTDNSNQERDENKADASNGKGSNTKVDFNQNVNSKTLTTNRKTGNMNLSNRPSYIGLAHELIHADHSMRGIAIDYSDVLDFTYKSNDGINHTQKNVPIEELSTIGLIKYHVLHTITENDIRKEHGLPLRSAYGIPKK
ncbi:MAG: hypothetical protein J5995_06165, partial [Muribaculaceae bacterium]|nr:hypothetical protein [Muribaculaceae bacterium]